MRVSARKRTRRGAAAVEMAFVLPLFVLLVLGQMELARVGMTTQLLNTASRMAARDYAILYDHTSTTSGADSQAAAKAKALEFLQGAGYSNIKESQISFSDLDPTTKTITVSIAVPYSQVGLFPRPYLISSASTLRGSAAMSIEDFDY